MNEKLQEAFSLRKNQDFRKAIDIYTPLWQQNPELFDEWAGWSYAFSLSKLNRYGEALDVCRAMYLRYQHAGVLNSLYASCIFYTQFRNGQTASLDVYRKAVKAMMKLSPPQAYSLTSIAIFKLIKALLNQQQIDWQEVENWLMKMDPDLLDERPFRLKDARDKQIELASPREEWYSNMIRAKGGLNKPRELLDVLDAARRQRFKWHYSNDIWFVRKEAFALNELGEREKAEKILREIIKRKRDWFLLYDLSLVVRDNKEALQLMIKAALAPGKDEHKLKLFQSLYEKLSANDDYQKIAVLHLCLIAAIREEHQWPAKETLSKIITRAGINPDNEGSSSAIKQKLIEFWKEIEKDSVHRLTGTVKTILPNGAAGFISSQHGSYYFKTGHLTNKLSPGNRVSFELEDGFDKKKNRATKIAVNIQLL